VRCADGTERVLHPKHLVLANGVSGNKVLPKVPGLDAFAGEILHTSDYQSGQKFRGKRALVLGTGTSGHDCAQDLHSSGADVKMIQRGSTTVIGLEAASMGDAPYLSGDLSTDDADLLAMVPTFTLLKKALQENTRRSAEHDKALLDGLARRGFKINYGPEDCGHQMQLRVRHGGYYLNCGCSDLIVDGEIGLLHWEDAVRSVLAVTASLSAFALLVNVAGLIPALASAVVLAAFGDGANNLRAILLLVVFCCVMSWLVFVVGLGSPASLFGE